MDSILILDFGSQTTQLISRRLRELGFYTRLLAGDAPFPEEGLGPEVKGIIFSGSPYSVYQDDAPRLDPAFLASPLPKLGICYGFQRMTEDLGGKVQGRETREYGRAPLRFLKAHPLFAGVPDGFVSWMSHGDSILHLAPGFEMISESDHGLPACAANLAMNLVGIQFHPEVTHCEYGNQILSNFAGGIAGAKAEWKVDFYLHESQEQIKSKVGQRKVLLLISGGVDSTVLGALLVKTLPADNVHLMYVDTGLMRKHETEEVIRTLESLGAKHVQIVRAEKDFLAALAGKHDPEEKRKAIGDLFIQIQEREISHLDLGDYLLAQGTLYTDLIESGKGIGKKAAVIKSHHNVRSPLIEAKRNAGLVIEPFGNLYKDEVRALGLSLGLSDKIVFRHPFPGPGLAVRILGEVTREKADLLREADALYIQELHNRGLYRKIWQAFCVLLPVRSVGVAGDAREYGHVIALRAITSADGMTADVYPFEMKDLLEISSLITNKIKAIGRVTYDISSKPPATIEWE